MQEKSLLLEYILIHRGTKGPKLYLGCIQLLFFQSFQSFQSFNTCNKFTHHSSQQVLVTGIQTSIDLWHSDPLSLCNENGQPRERLLRLFQDKYQSQTP